MTCRSWFVCLILAAPAMADDSIDYARDIKPILRHRCYACHAALKQRSGLRLDTVAAILKGGDGGAVVEPNKPDESRLIELVSAGDDSRMPPAAEGTPLSPEEIGLLRRWITKGAAGPADEQPQADPREHWSYRPPRRPEPPPVRDQGWARTPIDLFIAAQREKHGLTARPEAAPEIWLRRVYLDLIGLPPTREERQDFLADPSPVAYERVVDRLLASPHYGQRWGRHWMDVWRYSDWYGSRAINEIRYSQRHIWRWRDWIVDSLNNDKPYDRMVLEMLAGDEVAAGDPQVLRATGFIGRNWYKFDRNVWMFDTVEHTAQAFLGLTLRCARCHDHKYDPISQEDYYRFRAFFEPHDVRTDVLAAGVPTEKDAALGAVLKDGVARAFDKQLDAPTYVFKRGDSRDPDDKRPLTPGVPAALGGDALDIQPVQLPPESFYPSLKPFMVDALVAGAAAAVKQAEHEVETVTETAVAAHRQVDELTAREAAAQAAAPVEPPPAFRDDFSQGRPDAWQIVSGQWVYEDGKLVEKTVQNFATLVSKANHPRDFKARWRYRPLPEGKLRSIGFSFDYIDQGNSQDVYTHVNDTSQGIQAFHRQDGQQVYPLSAIVKTQTLNVGDEAMVEIAVRGRQLTIWLNGARMLDYALPIPRREGKFALWVHEATAEFMELEIRELVPTLADLRREQQAAIDNVALAGRKRATAQAELESVRARIAAEQARYSGRPTAEAIPSALVASHAERAVAAAKAAEAVLQTEQHLARARKVVQCEAVKGEASPAVAEAEMKLAAAQQGLAQAQAAMDAADGTYAPLGEQYPATSTGRRLALARWIANGQNPRTARVAVNQIWLRHFGLALVPSVEDFGLNGKPPTHPELLDWLAAELVQNGWRMKPIHKLIVLSNTYRMASSPAGPRDLNLAIDRDNRYLWRMNSRRMEAEVVRDCVLYAAGALDARLGGPEIPESEGQTNPRRSLYFRATPNEKMKFLELFDAADPNACYRRKESIVPQQALALLNSTLAQDQARRLAEQLTSEVGEQDLSATNAAFILATFERVLSRSPTADETRACLKFLAENTKLVQEPARSVFPPGGQAQRVPSAVPHLRARENLVLVLYSHNDFVTVR